MNPINSEDIIARQRIRILTRLDEAHELIEEYEDKRLTSSDPTEKLQAKKRVAELEQLIEEYQSKLDALDGMTPVTRGHGQDGPMTQSQTSPGMDRQPGEPSRGLGKTPPASIQDLDTKFEELKRDVADLKDGQVEIREYLTEIRDHELQMILSLLLESGVAQDDMKQMLDVVQTAVAVLQENESKLDERMQKAVVEASSELSNEASLQSKLELTLPVIPLILEYKVELAATNSVDLQRLVENAQTWWKSWTTRMSTRRLLKKYYGKFNAKGAFLTELQTQIIQGILNSKALLKAHQELTGLAGLSEAFVHELRDLGINMAYPKNELERNAELANSIASQARSAAGVVAANGNPAQQINHIERNLPMLRSTMTQLLAWFQGASASQVGVD